MPDTKEDVCVHLCIHTHKHKGITVRVVMCMRTNIGVCRDASFEMCADIYGTGGMHTGTQACP